VTDKYDPFNLGCSTNFFFFSSIEDFCFELFMRRINGGQCCPQNVKNESHVLMKKKKNRFLRVRGSAGVVAGPSSSKSFLVPLHFA
jgi:hypothetical protein